MSEARDPALDQLEPLIGEWDLEATHPQFEGVMRGRSVFEWLTGRAFLVTGAFEDGGRTLSGLWQVREDGERKDDLRIVYHRRAAAAAS